MQCVVYSSPEGRAQTLCSEWYGARVEPPFFFRFYAEGERLCFEAWREAAAQVHPDARPGAWQAELWRYDVVEFFLAAPDASRYLEFNLCPNGAWWARAFGEPRVPLPDFDAASAADVARFLQVQTSGELRDGRWTCRAGLSLPALRAWGWGPELARVAVAAVLCSEASEARAEATALTYLTTCEQRGGRPDFHRPWDWEPALLQ